MCSPKSVRRISISQAHAVARRLERRRGQCEACANWRRAAAQSPWPSTDAVAKQDVDQRTFTWSANIAQVSKQAQANVDQLVAEEGFKRLIAPFDGIVTARDTDIERADKRGSGRRRAAVRGFRNEQAARLCQRAAELCTERAAGHQGHDPRPRAPRQELPRHSRGFRSGRQSEQRHDPECSSLSTTVRVS